MISLRQVDANCLRRAPAWAQLAERGRWAAFQMERRSSRGSDGAMPPSDQFEKSAKRFNSMKSAMAEPVHRRGRSGRLKKGQWLKPRGPALEAGVEGFASANASADAKRTTSADKPPILGSAVSIQMFSAADGPCPGDRRLAARAAAGRCRDVRSREGGRRRGAAPSPCAAPRRPAHGRDHARHGRTRADSNRADRCRAHGDGLAPPCAARGWA